MAKLAPPGQKCVLVWEFGGIIDEKDPKLINRPMTNPPDPRREEALYQKTIWWFLPFEKPAPSLNRKELAITRNEVERLNLKPGDMVWINEYDQPIGIVDQGNEVLPFPPEKRLDYNEMDHDYPKDWIRLKGEGRGDEIARTLEIEAPIGAGTSGVVAAPPGAGKTTIIPRMIGRSMNDHPGLFLMVLLIAERKEEASALFTKDEQEPDLKPALSRDTELWFIPETMLPEDQWIISLAAFCRAMRKAENGKDVGFLIDSATRLVDAANKVVIDDGLLTGAVKESAIGTIAMLINNCGNLHGAGSITCIATCLTESKRDQVITDKIYGRVNWKVLLSIDLANKDIYPAILHAGTRDAQKLRDAQTGKRFDKKGRDLYFKFLRVLADIPASFRGKEDAVAANFRELSIALISSTPNNRHLFRLLEKAISEDIAARIEKAKIDKRREVKTTFDSVVAAQHLLLDILFSFEWEKTQPLLIRTVLDRICGTLREKDPEELEKWLLFQLSKIEEKKLMLEQKPTKKASSRPKTLPAKSKPALCTNCQREPAVKNGLCNTCSSLARKRAANLKATPDLGKVIPSGEKKK